MAHRASIFGPAPVFFLTAPGFSLKVTSLIGRPTRPFLLACISTGFNSRTFSSGICHELYLFVPVSPSKFGANHFLFGAPDVTLSGAPIQCSPCIKPPVFTIGFLIRLLLLLLLLFLLSTPSTSFHHEQQSLYSYLYERSRH